MKHLKAALKDAYLADFVHFRACKLICEKSWTC